MASSINASKLLPSSETVTVSSVRKSLVAVETQNNRQQVEVYTFLGKQLTSINRNVESIGRNLDTLTRAISGETRAELAQADATRRERLRDAERTAFGRSENIIESRLTSAITKPINKIKGAVSSKLFDLKKALLFLFGGWLTTKFLRMLEADAEGNTNKFEELKGEITTALAAAGAAFLVLNAGLGGLIATIGGLALRVAGFVLTKPFTALFNALKPKPTKPIPPPAGGSNRVPPAAGSGSRSGSGGGTRTNPVRPRPGVAPGSQPGSGGTILGPGGRPVPGQMQGTTPGRAPTIPSPKSGPPKITPSAARNFFSKPRSVLRGIKSLLGNARFLGALGPLLKGLYVVDKLKNRLDQGMSPTKAVVPVIPEILLTLKGAALGGGLAGAVGLTTGPGALLVGAAGAIGGGMLGSFLGGFLTDALTAGYSAFGIDNMLGFANDPITNFLQGLGLMKKPEEGGFRPGQGAAGQGGGMATPSVEPEINNNFDINSIPNPLNVNPTNTTQQTSTELMRRGPFDETPEEEMTPEIREALETLKGGFPMTGENEIPSQPTFDNENPYRNLAFSIYNISYEGR